MTTLRDKITNELQASDKIKKTVSISLPTEKLDALDQTIAALNSISGDTSFTRPKVFELALDSFLQEANVIIAENGVSLDNINHIQETPQDFDTVIFPAQFEGFKKAFLGEACWYYVRIGKEKIQHLKYVACYVGTPISAITHYAIIKDWQPVTIEDRKKFIIHFEGSAIALPVPIPLGDISPATVRSNRFVKLDNLMSASSYADLL